MKATLLCLLLLFGVVPSERTTSLPDSWLILYNTNNTDSISWKNWYIQQWNIPVTNVFGLDVSNNEKIHVNDFINQIFNPLQNHLNSNPELKSKLMGIIVGYRVPGNFYSDSNNPPLQGGGGYSVSSNLRNMTCSNQYKVINPHYFGAYYQPATTRLTKATLTQDHYLTARLDGPDLDKVKQITIRARILHNRSSPLPIDDKLYYDYKDQCAPGDEWTGLKFTVEGVNPGDRDHTAKPKWKFPWIEFESETDNTPNCALRFSYYRLTGWNSVDWNGGGSRICGFALNSWGATTVRSLTDHGGRYVPNILFNDDGPFISALGATAEPYLSATPCPATVVWCLALGWTLGEAAFHSISYDNHMWELVGDPLLIVKPWFPIPPDFDGDNDVDRLDFNQFKSCLSQSNIPYETECSRADIDEDGDVDQEDFGLFQRCISGSGKHYNVKCLK